MDRRQYLSIAFYNAVECLGSFGSLVCDSISIWNLSAILQASRRRLHGSFRHAIAGLRIVLWDVRRLESTALVTHERKGDLRKKAIEQGAWVGWIGLKSVRGGLDGGPSAWERHVVEIS